MHTLKSNLVITRAYPLSLAEIANIAGGKEFMPHLRNALIQQVLQASKSPQSCLNCVYQCLGGKLTLGENISFTKTLLLAVEKHKRFADCVYDTCEDICAVNESLKHLTNDL